MSATESTSIKSTNKKTVKAKVPKKLLEKKNKMERAPKVKFENRYFKCVYDGEIYGRYCGKTPKSVACKIFRNIVETKLDGKNKNNVDAIFGIQECTKGQCKRNLTKLHVFHGTRQKLDKPMEVTMKKAKDGRVIKFNFTSKVKKLFDKSEEYKNFTNEVKIKLPDIVGTKLMC